MEFPNGSDRRNKGLNLRLPFVAKYFTVGDENLGNIRIVKTVHFILALFVGCLSLGATTVQVISLSDDAHFRSNVKTNVKGNLVTIVEMSDVMQLIVDEMEPFYQFHDKPYEELIKAAQIPIQNLNTVCFSLLPFSPPIPLALFFISKQKLAYVTKWPKSHLFQSLPVSLRENITTPEILSNAIRNHRSQRRDSLRRELL